MSVPAHTHTEPATRPTEAGYTEIPCSESFEGEQLYRVAGVLPPVGYFLAATKGHPYVYEILDAAGTVVYVGVTSHLTNRIKSHYYTSKREGRGYVRWRATRQASLAEAEQAEARRIATLRPLHNVACGPATFGFALEGC